jgi:hypothetical protein
VKKNLMKKRQFSTVFESFFNQRIPLLFLFGAILLGVAGNSAYSLVLKAFGETTKVLVCILIFSSVGLLVVVFFLAMVLSFFGRRGSLGKGEAFSVPRKGIIYTAGKQTDTIALSLSVQKPDYVAFLCSSISEQAVNELLKKEGLDENRCSKKLLNPQDVEEIHAETKLAIDWMLNKGLKERDIAVDVTGGMTTMSVGAFALAEEMKVDTQYVKSEYDDRNMPIPGTQEGVFVRRYS